MCDKRLIAFDRMAEKSLENRLAQSFFLEFTRKAVGESCQPMEKFLRSNYATQLGCFTWTPVQEYLLIMYM